MMRILVCDDQQHFAERLATELTSVVGAIATVQCIYGDRLKSEVKALEDRRRASRQQEDSLAIPSAFDECDVVTIDYDLLGVSEQGFLTSEGLAYLIRCYSHAGVIVSLNEYAREPAFDLSLKSHPESFADLALSAKEIAYKNLWFEEKHERYRPWAWPLIPKLVQQTGERVKSLESELDSKLWTYFAFPETAQFLITREHQAFVAPNETGSKNVTFKEFIQQSGQGLKGKDVLDLHFASHIAAFRIGAWLENILLPGQDVLVDLPHLLERAPSLLKTRDVDHLRRSVSFDIPDTLDAVKIERLAPFEFAKKGWLSRRAWWWAEIQNGEALEEIAEPWNTEVIAERFAEDSSEYRPVTELKQFVSALTSPYARRYIEQVNGIVYRPSVRLSMK